MRYLTVMVVFALAVGALLLPGLDAPTVDGAAPSLEAPVAVCAVEEGSGRSTSISVLSTVNGPVQLSLFANRASAGSIGHSTGGSGSIVIPVVDVAAVGTVGGLIETPNALSAVGAVVAGAESMSAEACASMPHPQTFLAGGSTASGDTFVLHLMNPYAAEAIVELDVHSEAGSESNARFEAVVVPPRSSRLVDFTELIPGRESLSVQIESRRGSVIAVGRQGVGHESAVWQAVPTGQDWFVPVPRGSGFRTVLVGTPSAVDVEYQVDFYGPSGFEEGLVTGVLTSGGLASINLNTLPEDALGIRVISAGPIVATLWTYSEPGLSVTTGSTEAANRWFLPGAGTPTGGRASLVLMNVGIDTTSVSIRALGLNSTVRTLDIEVDAVVQLPIGVADGFLIESGGPIVALWSSTRDNASTAAIGVSLSDG
jgi:hypothetical protein